MGYFRGKMDEEFLKQDGWAIEMKSPSYEMAKEPKHKISPNDAQGDESFSPLEWLRACSLSSKAQLMAGAV